MENKELINDLFEHFYNQKSLNLTIEKQLDEFEWKKIPEFIKSEVKEIRDLVWVSQSIAKQIDKIMNELLNNE